MLPTSPHTTVPKGRPCLRVLQAAGNRARAQHPGPWPWPPSGAGFSWVEAMVPLVYAALTVVPPDSCGLISSCASFQKPPEDLFSNSQSDQSQAHALAAKKYKDRHGLLHLWLGAGDKKKEGPGRVAGKWIANHLWTKGHGPVPGRKLETLTSWRNILGIRIGWVTCTSESLGHPNPVMLLNQELFPPLKNKSPAPSTPIRS